MKIHTPEISWHNRDPVFSVDIQKRIEYDDQQNAYYRIATTGSDKFVAIWRAYLNKITSSKQTHSKSTNNLFESQLDKVVHEIMNDLLDQSASAFDNVLQETPLKVEKNKSKEKKLIDLEIVCTLNHHERAVNVAKFAPKSNLLASGSDDAFVCICEYIGESDQNNQLDKDRCNPFNNLDDAIITKENWKRVHVLRRHINDVVDLAWSPDERFLITGSVDNISYVWDVKKGEALFELPKHSGYVQGVAWDPLNNFIATLCTDRNLRIFNAPTSEKSKKCTLMHDIKRFKLNSADDKSKSYLFYDDTLATISRRLCFSPNGELLACPSGIVEIDEKDDDEEDSNKFINCLHMFTRADNFKKLHCYFPTGVYTNSIQFCQKLFKLNPDLPNPYPFPYRLVFAIAAQNKILIYDTQQEFPIAKISDIHYTRISDLSWTVDGQLLLASSTDGYCTFIQFDEHDLGEPYVGEPYKYEVIEPITTKKSSNAGQTNKKSKVANEENVSNENIAKEKTSQTKISNFLIRKPNVKPLEPTKLEYSFQKVSDNNKVNFIDDDSNDIQVIEIETNNNQKQLDTQSKSITKELNSSKSKAIVELTSNSKPVATIKPITTNSIQHLLKRKQSSTPLNNTNDANQQFNQLDEKNDENLKANINVESVNLPMKRGLDQTSLNDQQERKKKRASFTTLS